MKSLANHIKESLNEDIIDLATNVRQESNQSVDDKNKKESDVESDS